MPKDDKPETPETYEELFPGGEDEHRIHEMSEDVGELVEGYQGGPVGQLPPIPFYPPGYEQAKRGHKIAIVTVGIAIAIGELALWGAMLFDIIWLKWVMAPVAAGIIYALGNILITVAKRSFKRRYGPPSLRPLSPEQTAHFNKRAEEARKVFMREQEKAKRECEKRVEECFGDYCAEMSRFSRERAKKCITCPIKGDCMMATQARVMQKIYRESRHGDDWRGDDDD